MRSGPYTSLSGRSGTGPYVSFLRRAGYIRPLHLCLLFGPVGDRPLRLLLGVGPDISGPYISVHP